MRISSGPDFKNLAGTFGTERVAAGESRQEALRLIRDGIESHIEGLREAGEPVPTSASSAEVVEIGAT